MQLVQTLRHYRPSRGNLRAGGKKLFWVWIGYQTIKGTLTTSLIWAPLAYAMWGGS